MRAILSGRTCLATFVAVFATFALAPRAQAASILFEHAFPTTNADAWCTSCAGNYRMWDNFVLDASYDVTQVEAVLSIYGDLASLDLEYSIWNQSRTTQLFSQTLGSELDFVDLGSAAYDVSAALSGLTLDAGNYYLSIYGGNVTNYIGWYQAPTTVDGKSYQSAGAAPLPLDGDGTGLDMAFRVLGTRAAETVPVPEPTTLFLLGTGVCVVAVRRWRLQG